MGRGIADPYRLVPLIAAAGQPDRVVAQELGLTEDGVRAFRRTRRLPSRFRKPTRPAPPRPQIEGRTLTAVTRAHGCRAEVARRWFAVYGIEPARPVLTPSKPPRVVNRRKGKSLTSQEVGEIARAVSILRNRFPSVHRCDIRLYERSRETFGDKLGLPDHGRGWWWIETVGAVDRETMMRMARG